MTGVPLETCPAFNERWNNKFYYKLHLVGISTESYYGARIHENEIYNHYILFRGLHHFQHKPICCSFRAIRNTERYFPPSVGRNFVFYIYNRAALF